MKLIPLRRPTNKTFQGPITTIAGSTVTVRYDHEEDGAAEWTELTFVDVLQVETRNVSACSEEDVAGSDYITADDSSDELKLLEARWQTAVGWHETTDRPPLTRYQVFFDDAAVVIVFARGVRIEDSAMQDAM